LEDREKILLFINRVYDLEDMERHNKINSTEKLVLLIVASFEREKVVPTYENVLEIIKKRPPSNYTQI
jgi:hypothetical protein